MFLRLNVIARWATLGIAWDVRLDMLPYLSHTQAGVHDGKP